MLQPVIMAGGSGSRLWPLSRHLNPKQFLALVSPEVTLLQATIQRLEGLDAAAPRLICNEEHRFLAAEQLRQLGLDEVDILLESVGRNTAPAIALATSTRWRCLTSERTTASAGTISPSSTRVRMGLVFAST